MGRNSKQLDGKIAIITGGSRGIGRSIAVALALEGATVVVCSRNLDSNRDTAEYIKSLGGNARCHRVDVTDPDSVSILVEDVLKEYGRIDILVNNAGVTADNLLLRLKEADWDKVVDTNLKGTFNCTKAVVRAMLKQRSGKIINIASVVGIVGNPGQANYCASKAGVIGLTKSVARELGSRNITANCVAPGFIRTKMTDALPEKAREEMLKLIPLGRLGEPEDVAEIVKFLASPAADYITGEVIRADGGMAM
ncbi:MAG: 3-oxoacyl-[acyl-carrier-protein] reductase [Candidatus Abyssobacteria bacterium SURF_17]|uniref:3-oxoacyl-[acyl-carrier-protein] reductase n=1 Tax=Candidatus Abyssobacteria bacterium SURF_17 TaxID=2093361 RepID=A0A419ET60_9BACT|nr:MAG: 3-oxoacyl-[acyl-carrier-protein] reductase [Candidatus Abyssubacteria bacterium SURF_17]